MISTYRITPIPGLIPDQPLNCTICGKPIPVIDGILAAHYPHEPDCPRRHTDIQCSCDLNVHPGCCPDCHEDYP